MERYREYKDSGIQWLGQIPGHWKTMRGKNLFNKEQRPVQEGDDIVTCFRDGEVTLRKNRRISGFTEATDYSHYQHICKGDLVIHQMDAFAGSSGVSDSDGMGTPVLSVCTSKTELTNNYYYAHILRLMGWNGYILSLYRGIRERSSDFRFDTFARLWLPVPPLVEQQAIVSYLDDKCGKIDKMLEGKQKQIELLAEMKQRIIADAVTRGLNPNVKMKATNIPWLPEIPEHWKMSKVSSHFKQRNEKVSDKDYPALSVSKLGVTPQLSNVALSNAEGCSRKLVKVGDYAVNSRSDRKGSCGVSKYEGSVSLITIVLEPFNINGEYVHHLFRSNPWIEEFYRNGRGIVADLWTTNYQMMKSMYMPIPPLSEQRTIVAHINSKVSKIEALTQKLQQEIESIKEYKQRLISDAVTGQIKIQ